MANGEIAAKCWGWNKYGQLGYGDTANRGDAPSEMGDYLPFLNISLVSSATCDAAAMQKVNWHNLVCSMLI